MSVRCPFCIAASSMPLRWAATNPDPASTKAQYAHGDSFIIYSGIIGSHRHCGHCRTPRATQKGRRQFHGLVPFSWGKIALFQRQPEQTVLPLLWLRREWRCDQIPDGTRRHDICRSRQGPGPAIRPAGPRGRCVTPGPGQGGALARAAGHPCQRDRKGCRRLCQAVARLRAGHCLPEGARRIGRDRQNLWPGLRARRLA